MIQVSRLTRSAHPLVSLADASVWCSAAISSVDGTVNATDRTLVQQIVASVQDYLEQQLGRSLHKNTLQVSFDLDEVNEGGDTLFLHPGLGPIVPLLSVQSVTCYDDDGDATVLVEGTDYRVQRGEHLGRIVLLDGVSWPSELRDQVAVVVELTAGYGPTAATVTLATVAAGATLVVNGLTFTAHAATTTKANREFSVSGSDAADAAELAACINDATYGVAGVAATVSGATVTLTVTAVNQVALDVVASASTMTVTVSTSNVPGVIALGAKELITYFYRNPGSGLVVNPESGAMRDAAPHPGIVIARIRACGYGRTPGFA